MSKIKTIRTVARDASGATVSSSVTYGLKTARASLWEAADVLGRAGHRTGEIFQRTGNAKAWAVYAWESGCRQMPIVRHDPADVSTDSYQLQLAC